MSFTIDQKHYNQKQGLFIQRVGEDYVYTMLSTSCLWYRKVDDTFAIISYDFGETLQQLNDIDESIEFIMEKGSKGNLPFLDYIIGLNERREIIRKVHRKPTCTGQYPQFS